MLHIFFILPTRSFSHKHTRIRQSIIVLSVSKVYSIVSFYKTRALLNRIPSTSHTNHYEHQFSSLTRFALEFLFSSSFFCVCCWDTLCNSHVSQQTHLNINTCIVIVVWVQFTCIVTQETNINDDVRVLVTMKYRSLVDEEKDWLTVRKGRRREKA